VHAYINENINESQLSSTWYLISMNFSKPTSRLSCATLNKLTQFEQSTKKRIRQVQ